MAVFNVCLVLMASLQLLGANRQETPCNHNDDNLMEIVKVQMEMVHTLQVTTVLNEFTTVRKHSCGKVMF